MTTPKTPIIEGQPLPEDFDLTDPLHVRCADGKVYELRGIRVVKADIVDASMTVACGNEPVTITITFNQGKGVTTVNKAGT